MVDATLQHGGGGLGDLERQHRGLRDLDQRRWRDGLVDELPAIEGHSTSGDVILGFSSGNLKYTP